MGKSFNFLERITGKNVSLYIDDDGNGKCEMCSMTIESDMVSYEGQQDLE